MRTRPGLTFVTPGKGKCRRRPQRRTFSCLVHHALPPRCTRRCLVRTRQRAQQTLIGLRAAHSRGRSGDAFSPADFDASRYERNGRCSTHQSSTASLAAPLATYVSTLGSRPGVRRSPARASIPYSKVILNDARHLNSAAFHAFLDLIVASRFGMRAARSQLLPLTSSAFPLLSGPRLCFSRRLPRAHARLAFLPHRAFAASPYASRTAMLKYISPDVSAPAIGPLSLALSAPAGARCDHEKRQGPWQGLLRDRRSRR